MYADWLLDHGDVRGQLIGLKRRCEVDQLHAVERMEILDRMNALWDQHQPDWLQGLVLPRSTRLRWRHGFLVGVSFFWPGGGVIEALQALAVHPVGRLLSEIEVERLPPTEIPEPLLDAIAALPPRSLSLGFFPLDVAVVEQLVGSPAVDRLTALKLDGLGPGGLEALLWRGQGLLEGLTELDLSHSPLGPSGAELLADAPARGLRSLSRLRLRRTAIGCEGARRLSRSGALAGLTALDLSDNLLGEEGAREIAEASALSDLSELSLYGNDIGDEGLAALSRSDTLRGLETLDVGFNGIGPQGSAALAAAEGLRGLTELRLHGNQLGDGGISTLAASGLLSSLERLRLSDNYLSCEGAIALARRAPPSSLRVLELCRNHLRDRGAIALAGAPILQDLEHLDLRQNHVGAEGARALVSAIPSLMVWALEDNDLKGPDLEELRELQRSSAPEPRPLPRDEPEGSLARLLRGVLRWIPSFGRT